MILEIFSIDLWISFYQQNFSPTTRSCWRKRGEWRRKGRVGFRSSWTHMWSSPLCQLSFALVPLGFVCSSFSEEGKLQSPERSSMDFHSKIVDAPAWYGLPFYLLIISKNRLLSFSIVGWLSCCWGKAEKGEKSSFILMLSLLGHWGDKLYYAPTLHIAGKRESRLHPVLLFALFFTGFHFPFQSFDKGRMEVCSQYKSADLV